MDETTTQFDAINATLINKSLQEYFKTLYSKTPSVKKFFSFRRPSDFSLDTVLSNTKKNIPYFLLYHLVAALGFYLIFLARNINYLFPFISIIVLAFFLNYPTTIKEFEITPLVTLLTFLGINFIGTLMFPVLIKGHINIFALTCFVLILMLVHSIFVKPEDEYADDLGLEKELLGGI